MGNLERGGDEVNSSWPVIHWRRVEGAGCWCCGWGASARQTRLALLHVTVFGSLHVKLGRENGFWDKIYGFRCSRDSELRKLQKLTVSTS
jgi:hypothetical protein